MSDKTSQTLENVPSFYASGVGIGATGTDIKLVFTDHHFPVDQKGQVDSNATQRPCAIVSLSFHNAKDLYVLLGKALSDWEQNFGELNTPFLKDARESSK